MGWRVPDVSIRPKFRRTALSLEEKVNILGYYDLNRTKKLSEISCDLNMPRSTLRSLLKKRKEIESLFNGAQGTSAIIKRKKLRRENKKS